MRETFAVEHQLTNALAAAQGWRETPAGAAPLPPTGLRWPAAGIG